MKYLYIFFGLMLLIASNSFTIYSAHDNNWHNLSKKIAQQYQREFTILDLTNNNGLFYQSIHSPYDFSYIIIQKEFGSNVLPLLNQNNVILLKHDLTFDDLSQLSTCEYFDIILFPINLYTQINRKRLSFILSRLSNIVIFVNDNYTNGDWQHTILSNLFGHVLHKNHNTLIVYNSEKILRHGWFRGRKKRYLIISNFKQKYFIKSIDLIPNCDKPFFIQNHIKLQKIIWHRGINLWTYIMFNGINPSKKYVEQLLKNYIGQKQYLHTHTDNNPWNFIIQGASIIPIDCRYTENPNIQDMRSRLKRALNWLYNPPWHLAHIQ